MSIIFNGNEFASKKEKNLKKAVLDLKAKGIYPHLASIIIGNNPASEMYLSMKKKRGEAIGIQVDIYKLPINVKKEELLALIKLLNEDPDFTGLMIQMPLPIELENSKLEILNSINQEKDVDGLKENSKFLHPTSKAVIEIMNYAKDQLAVVSNPLTVCVVGATGMVGTPLVKELKRLGYKVIEADIKTTNLQGSTLQADVLISAVGITNLITSDMVKKDAIVIDVGSPKGDVDFAEVSKIAGFITPVPGGVGPVTISCLMQNLVDKA